MEQEKKHPIQYYRWATPADSGTIKTSLDFQREIGMMPQGDLLIEDLTVAEFRRIKSRTNQLKQADINGLLEMVELRGSKEQMVGSLSGGQRDACPCW